MNFAKIFLFVVCVSNQRLFEECKKDLESVVTPTGYTKEVLPIYGAKSMTEGYNRALSHQAKYKLYIHQDTFILNKNILQELLQLFSDSQLGLIGMIGCKKFKPGGVWWEGEGVTGKLLDYRNNDYITYEFQEAKYPYDEVQSIDGFFMATQYDIPWKEEINGFHFYDASQSLEFIKKGYKVGIPFQVSPWTAHINKGRTEHYDKQQHLLGQQIFLHYYSSVINEMNHHRV